MGRQVDRYSDGGGQYSCDDGRQDEGTERTELEYDRSVRPSPLAVGF
jgi:hypothetical protein